MSSSVRATACGPRPERGDLPKREREREREPCVHRIRLAGIDVNDIGTASYFVPPTYAKPSERERERERERSGNLRDLSYKERARKEKRGRQCEC